MAPEPSRLAVAIPTPPVPEPTGFRSDQPQQTRDWESEVLEFLQSSGRVSLTEILFHFTHRASAAESAATATAVSHEIRLAVRSLGERCCLYLDEGKYCASV
jgi:hypothetical protein